MIFYYHNSKNWWFMLDELGSVVHFHRKRSGLTQEELARLAGVGKTVIFDIENGKKSLRLTTLMAILHALNIDLNLISPLMLQWEREKDARS